MTHLCGQVYQTKDLTPVDPSLLTEVDKFDVSVVREQDVVAFDLFLIRHKMKALFDFVHFRCAGDLRLDACSDSGEDSRAPETIKHHCLSVTCVTTPIRHSRPSFPSE